MSDIFISYSRKDSSHALALAEQLRSNGIDVWIDQHGIGGAEKWATEIAQGIRACSTFLLLLSPDSIQSENVLRELSLASEKRKRILPVDLIAAELPSSFEYSLAGLQRVAITDFNGILSAHKHGVSRIAVKDLRKSLIVLPFEDLSPTGEDNAWFADGLAGEMIDSLGHIKSLRILDRKTSIALRNTKLRTVEIGKEFNTRYFIEGSVRKFGEQIKISVALLDIETGDYLWQESHRGEFKDIFDIQEAVADKVVAGLKLHLTKEEKTLLQERGTENAEAYELFIKATEYFKLQTAEGLGLANQLLSETILLDPSYASAYQYKSYTLASIYRSYDRDPNKLIEAEELVNESLRLKPNSWKAYHSLSLIYQLQGKLEEAESAAKRFNENAPEDYSSHFGLGYFYWSIGQSAKAIAPLEQALSLMPGNISMLNALVVACEWAKDQERLQYWASYAIPYSERYLKLNPDDENKRVSHAILLQHAGRMQEAREAAHALDNIRDGESMFNTAGLWVMLNDKGMGIKVFRKSIEVGYRNTPMLKGFFRENLTSFKGTPEYEEVKQMVEKIEAEQLAATEKEARVNG